MGENTVGRRKVGGRRNRTRYTGMTADERKAAMQPLREGYARWLTNKRAEDLIDKLVETAPPLTATQRARLAVLLNLNPSRETGAGGGE